MSSVKRRRANPPVAASALTKGILEVAPRVLMHVAGPFEVSTGFGPAGYVVRVVGANHVSATRDFVHPKERTALRRLHRWLLEELEAVQTGSRPTIPAPAPCRFEPRPAVLPRRMTADDEPAPATIHSAR